MRTLLVSDAFIHVLRPVKGVAGFFMRRLGILPGLCIGNTFRWLAVRDRALRRWATDVLSREQPRRLAVSWRRRSRATTLLSGWSGCSKRASERAVLR